MRTVASLSLAFILCTTLTAASSGFGTKDEFPPPEQVFRYVIQSDGTKLAVLWNVAPGYYLYKKRLAILTDTPGVTLGTPHFPKGLIQHDEYFGDQEVYRDDFTVTVPVTLSADAIQTPTSRLHLKLKLQGCADAGLCYPPAVWTTSIVMPIIPLMKQKQP